MKDSPHPVVCAKRTGLELAGRDGENVVGPILTRCARC